MSELRKDKLLTQIVDMQSVEIVKCEDCELFTPSAWVKGKGHCCRLGIMRPFDWFCADGRLPEIDADE